MSERLPEEWITQVVAKQPFAGRWVFYNTDIRSYNRLSRFGYTGMFLTSDIPAPEPQILDYPIEGLQAFNLFNLLVHPFHFLAF